MSTLRHRQIKKKEVVLYKFHRVPVFCVELEVFKLLVERLRMAFMANSKNKAFPKYTKVKIFAFSGHR